MSDIKPSSNNHNVPEFSVSEVSNALKRVVESNFSYVRVRGEISGLKIAASGHVYLSLKDDKSVLSGICWKGVAGRLRFKPEDGLEVVATGKLTTYAGRSNYQIIIESMEPAGEGALMALLEKRKKEMAAEGLFAPERKQELPYLPQTIGVVTSPTGSVIRDILHRLEDRMPCHVLVWPVLVQGDNAAAQITAAINGFNKLNKANEGGQQADPAMSVRSTDSLHEQEASAGVDLIIVARGGGSIEDLWPFNEEEVVRAVATSNIPVISAVGHETDTTLIDYVSDKRAPTPTAAAEIAVPVRADLLYTLRDNQQRMDSLLQARLTHHRQQIEGLARGLPKPADILANAQQSLDILTDKLGNSLRMLVTAKNHQLQQTSNGLRPTLLQRPLKEQSRQLSDMNERLNDRFTRLVERKENQLQHLGSKLKLLDYNNVLKRGFALVKNDAGELITSVKQAANIASITFHDGDANIGGANIPVTKKPKKQKLAKTDELQESLF